MISKEELQQILKYLEWNTITGHLCAIDMLKELLKKKQNEDRRD